jgi:hypothetical protein
VDYLQYIKDFSWYEMKYTTKKSLAELVAIITKVNYLSPELLGNALQRRASEKTVGGCPKDQE